MKKAHASPPPDEEKFTQAFDTWLAGRPKAAPTLKAFIASIKPKLTEARRKGVTYEQLVAFLREQGVACSISTLKAYLAVKRRPKSGGKTVKNNQPPSAKSPTAAAKASAKPVASTSIPPIGAAQPGIKDGTPDDDF